MVRFRGPNMDTGATFEMGCMPGAGKPVFGYYDAAPFYGVGALIQRGGRAVAGMLTIATAGGS